MKGNPMSEQPLSLQWLCFLRDHGQDLKISKEARVLASVLVTYGQGRKIFASMVTLSKVTGMKRETVRNARRELEAKGLLEDITGDPDKQERTYRLAMPGYVTPERDTLKVVPERTTPGPPKDHPLVPERTTPGPLEGHNIKLEDQARDQAQHHQPGGARDGEQHSSSTEKQAPSGPRPAGADEPYEFGPEGREHWAGLLGVPLSSIRASFWTWYGLQVNQMYHKAYDGCECPCQASVSGACTHPEDEYCPCPCPASGTDECECCVHYGYWQTAVSAGEDAARDAAEKRSPVGYFQTVLMQQVDRALWRAKGQAA